MSVIISPETTTIASDEANTNSWLILFYFIYCVYRHFQQYFSYIMATSFSDGRGQTTRIEWPALGKQLVNLFTRGCESSTPFFVIYKAGCESTPYWW